MRFKIFGVRIGVHFLFTAVISILLCVDKSGLMIYSLISVVIHEAGHLVVMLLFGQKPNDILLCASGVHIRADNNNNRWTHFAIAVGGPAANIIPALFIDNLYFRTAMLVNGMFNLLPVTGTDGSDILDCLLGEIALSRWGSMIKITLNISVIMLCSILGAVMLKVYTNPTLLVSALYFIIMLISSFC